MATFFPMAHELTAAVNWLKQHPVVATVATVAAVASAAKFVHGEVQRSARRQARKDKRKAAKAAKVAARKAVEAAGEAKAGDAESAPGMEQVTGAKLVDVVDDADSVAVCSEADDMSDASSSSSGESPASDDDEEGAGMRRNVSWSDDVSGRPLTSVIFTDEADEEPSDDSQDWGWYVPMTPPEHQLYQ